MKQNGMQAMNDNNKKSQTQAANAPSDDLSLPQFVNSALCPLCSKSNNCAIEDGQEHCWCMEQSKPLAQDAVDMIPAELKNKSCICKTCWHSF